MDALVDHYKQKADLKEQRLGLNGMQSTPALDGYGAAELTREQNDQLTADEERLRNDAYQAFQSLPSYFDDPPRVLPQRLEKPVLIPQRRQGDRLRGFQLLYAPALAESGVSEQQFIKFLNRLNVAIGFDNKIKIFNFAIDIGTIACSSWELLVATIGTQALTTTAAHIKSRARSEAYVAHANQSFFHLRGLHAQIVPASSVYPTQSIPPSNGDELATRQSTFQFSLGSPNVLPENHPKARGGMFNLNKRPIEYDPFDYGPGYVKIKHDQYSPLQPSQYQEPAISLVDRAAEKVEKYNIWQDRLPAKKNARRIKKRQQTIEEIQRQGGQMAVLRYLEQEEEEHRKELEKRQGKLGRFLDRNKVILIVTNLNDRDRAQMQSTLSSRRS